MGFSRATHFSLNSKVTEFISFLKTWKNDGAQKLFLLFDSSNKISSNTIKRRVKFVYNAFLAKNANNIDIELFFINQQQKQPRLNEDFIFINEDVNSSLNTESMISGFETLELPKKRSHIVLGGTFDRLHDGHGLILATSLILAKKSISIGITSDLMIKNKLLAELIEPYSSRLGSVSSYLSTCAPQLNFKFCSLSDGIGFSGEADYMETLVTTTETQNGIFPINEKRIMNGLPPLENFVIDILLPIDNSLFKNKLSSSFLRWNQSGELLRPPSNFGDPYIIGVTGNICSGKSSICSELKNLGAHVIDCDSLAHTCYNPGTECYEKLVSHFGKDILTESSAPKYINRKKLGSIVFNDQSQLTALNNIVWPYLRKCVSSLVENLGDKGIKIVVMEAALLYEANLHEFTHEVWLCVVSEQQAVSRIQDRLGVDHNVAVARYNASQRLMNSFEKAKMANLIISTHFDKCVTATVLKKAWNSLLRRISHN